MVEKGPAESVPRPQRAVDKTGNLTTCGLLRSKTCPEETPNGSRGPLSSKRLRSADDARESGV